MEEKEIKEQNKEKEIEEKEKQEIRNAEIKRRVKVIRQYRLNEVRAQDRKKVCEFSKPYFWLSICFVVILILSNISASNTMDIGGLISLSAAEILFPISYVISDLFVELFGFRRTRKLIFGGLIVTLLAMVFLYLTTLLPTGYGEYVTVFGFFNGGVIGITLASIIAYVVGSLVNAFIMEKLKNKHGETHFFLRAMSSTVVAEILDSLVFITFCCLLAPEFYDFARLFQFVFTISLIKIAVEYLLFPLTKYLLKLIKKNKKKI